MGGANRLPFFNKEIAMKKLLNAVAVMLVMTLAAGAYAGWNIRQNADGTTSWVNVDGDSYPVAREYLTVNLENLGTASTAYISVPFAGSIVQVDAIVNGVVTTTTETLTVSIMSTTSPGADFIKISNNNTLSVASAIVTGQARIGYLLGGPGHFVSSGEMTGKSTDHSDANEQLVGNPHVSSGGTIAISTAGNSGADVDATIVIHYDRDQSGGSFR
jgi:hypothetical protein|tara:strand:- start:326 stop:973 length:648 start_codon:yes stop_codon:yes gene_type:complete